MSTRTSLIDRIRMAVKARAREADGRFSSDDTADRFREERRAMHMQLKIELERIFESSKDFPSRQLQTALGPLHATCRGMFDEPVHATLLAGGWTVAIITSAVDADAYGRTTPGLSACLASSILVGSDVQVLDVEIATPVVGTVDDRMDAFFQRLAEHISRWIVMSGPDGGAWP